MWFLHMHTHLHTHTIHPDIFPSLPCGQKSGGCTRRSLQLCASCAHRICAPVCVCNMCARINHAYMCYVCTWKTRNNVNTLALTQPDLYLCVCVQYLSRSIYRAHTSSSSAPRHCGSSISRLCACRLLSLRFRPMCTNAIHARLHTRVNTRDAFLSARECRRRRRLPVRSLKTFTFRNASQFYLKRK